MWMMCAVTLMALYCVLGNHESPLIFFGTRIGHGNVEVESSGCHKSTNSYEFDWMEVCSEYHYIPQTTHMQCRSSRPESSNGRLATIRSSVLGLQ